MASESHDLGVGAVRRAINASFDLTMLRTALRTAGVEYRPPAVACTLDAFRILEPLAQEHRLEEGTQRRRRR